MKKFLVLHGLNHDKMGMEPNSVHPVTMAHINELMEKAAAPMGVTLGFYQNNDSSKVIKKILGASSEGYCGIVFNPAAWMDNGTDIAAALLQINIPVVEVHMSNTNKTETAHNVIAPAVTGLVTGFGEQVYMAGLALLAGLSNKA